MVARGLPENLTVDGVTKFVPLSVRVKVIPPAVAELVESDDNVGTGLLTVKF